MTQTKIYFVEDSTIKIIPEDKLPKPANEKSETSLELLKDLTCINKTDILFTYIQFWKWRELIEASAKILIILFFWQISTKFEINIYLL